MPVKVRPVEQAFWYKAYGILLSGIPSTFEGPVEAACVAGAMDKVRAKSVVWAIRKLMNIRIYAVDTATGEVEDTYQMAVNLETDHAHIPALIEHQPEEPKIDVFGIYKNASWTRETEIPATYSTVRLVNQQRSAEK